MSIACPVCAAANPDGSRFCNSCGSRLPDHAALAEERKVITALFCDLIGFTATSESADPEDVDRMLTRYFATARSQIEAHGGVVEKFIGDAVVGVFGVPQAHEDDPERAIRAALRICEDAASLSALGGAPLRLRVGINTGEALVRLAVTPGAGERFLAGDAVNTASRIQSVAPEMGVAVGEASYEATKRQFEYEELPPATLKGKAEPVRVFHPIAPRSRLGTDLTRVTSTPLVGRSAELGELTALFDAATRQRSVRFATIVGEPGLGKSRLVSELLGYVDAQPVLVTWRQGRCLPYGTGISFWALGEIVKAHAGILESDGIAAAVEKLDRVLPESDDRVWLRDRLLPLLGIESGPAAGREEQFTAWRRFLEAVAEHRPTVLVFEDLHWADEPMLSFLEELAGRPATVPLLVVGTTRPELFDRRATYPGIEGATRIDLRPLSADAVSDLARALLDGAEIAPDLREPILDRAGGNPLFVEEFIRLLRDDDVLVEAAGRLVLREGAALPVPDSIQALLAARLDALPPDEKGLLTDASVVGKVFWSGAVAAMGDRDPAVVARQLDHLASREFIRAAPRSSMSGESEFAFWHVLVRDAAYGALPRAARVARHAAAAEWIEEHAGDRIEDVADVLAHHYATALDLARAAGEAAHEEELKGPALRFLLLAGERALELDVTRAVDLLERALALTPPGHPLRPAVLRRYGVAMNYAGRPREAVAALDEALEGFRSSGDVLATADVLGKLSSNLREIGEARGWDYPRQAVDLLEELGPSWPLAHALVRLSFVYSVSGRLEESLATADRAEAVAAAIGHASSKDIDEQRGNLLSVRGLTRTALGDERGFDDIEEALRLNHATGQADRNGHLYGNYALQLGSWRGPRASAGVLEEGLAFATSRGLQGHVAWLRQIRLLEHYDLGEHDLLLADLPALEELFEAGGAGNALVELRAYRIRVAALRGERTDDGSLAWLEQVVRESGDPENMVGLGATAQARVLRGERATAQGLLRELSGSVTRTGWWWLPRSIASLVRAALQLDDIALAESLVSEFDVRMPYAQHAEVAAKAAILEAQGELAAAIEAYAEAADRWERFGVVPEHAFALLGHGRSLVAIDRGAEAIEPLNRARELFARLRAAPALAEIEVLLADGAG